MACTIVFREILKEKEIKLDLVLDAIDSWGRSIDIDTRSLCERYKCVSFQIAL